MKAETLETLPTEPNHLDQLETERPLNHSFEEEKDERSITTKADKSVTKEPPQQLAPSFKPEPVEKRQKSPTNTKKVVKQSKSAAEFKKNNPYQPASKQIDAEEKERSASKKREPEDPKFSVKEIVNSKK